MGKHENTLASIFSDPPPANIHWRSIESMFVHFGAELSAGSGSRVRVVLNGVRGVFHRPHPQKEAHRGLIRSVKRFLQAAKIQP